MAEHSAFMGIGVELNGTQYGVNLAQVSHWEYNASAGYPTGREKNRRLTVYFTTGTKTDFYHDEAEVLSKILEQLCGGRMLQKAP